jgi:dihydroflavonol-4-reductase
MKIFLTGASGFLGSHIAKKLLDRGHHVTALTNKTNVPLFFDQSKLNIINGNLLYKKDYISHIKDNDLIIHSAASIKPDHQSHCDNINMTRNLCQVANEMKIPKFIFISTRSTIGISNPVERSNDFSSNFENESIFDSYIKSKLECEKILRENLDNNINLIIICPTALVGPNDTKPTPIGLLLKNIIRNKIKIFIDGYINIIDVRYAASVISEISEINDFQLSKFGLGYKNIQLSKLISELKLFNKSITIPYKLPKIIINLVYYFFYLFPFFEKINPFLSAKRIKRLRKGYSCFENNENIKNLKSKKIDFSKTLNDIVKYYNE